MAKYILCTKTASKKNYTGVTRPRRRQALQKQQPDCLGGTEDSLYKGESPGGGPGGGGGIEEDGEDGGEGTDGGRVSGGGGGGAFTKEKAIRHIGQLAWRSNQEAMHLG